MDDDRADFMTIIPAEQASRGMFPFCGTGSIRNFSPGRDKYESHVSARGLFCYAGAEQYHPQLPSLATLEILAAY